MGYNECKLNEDQREEISNLGNWGLNVQEMRYSTIIPLGIINSKAHLRKTLIAIQELDCPLLRGSVMLFSLGSKRPKLILTQTQQTMQHAQQQDAVAVKFTDRITHHIYNKLEIFGYDKLN